MRIAYGRLGPGNRTTLPKEVRAALNVKAGDTLSYRFGRRGEIALAGAPSSDTAYLQSISFTLCEWSSGEDAAAYDKL